MTRQEVYRNVKEMKENVYDYIAVTHHFDNCDLTVLYAFDDYIVAVRKVLNDRVMSINKKMALLDVISCGSYNENCYSFNMPSTKACMNSIKMTMKEYKRGYVNIFYYDRRGKYHFVNIHKDGRVSFDPYTR